MFWDAHSNTIGKNSVTSLGLMCGCRWPVNFSCCYDQVIILDPRKSRNPVDKNRDTALKEMCSADAGPYSLKAPFEGSVKERFEPHNS